MIKDVRIVALSICYLDAPAHLAQHSLIQIESRRNRDDHFTSLCTRRARAGPDWIHTAACVRVLGLGRCSLARAVA